MESAFSGFSDKEFYPTKEEKGARLGYNLISNHAFVVSAGFVFGGHLALTMAFDSNYVVPMIVGKLISGICAVLLAVVMYKEK